jgi:protein TonB
MNTPSAYQNPSWDELIFEKRNKKYGAYVIRKYANQRTFSSFFITIFTLTGLIILIGSWANKSELIKLTSTPHEFLGKELDIVYDFDKKETSSSKGQKSSNPSPSKPNNQKLNDNFLVVASVENEKKNDVDTTSAFQNNEKANGKNLGASGTGNEPDTSGIATNGSIDGNGLNNVIDIPEFYPEFPGGESKMFEFLSNQLRFPRNYQGNKTSTTVYISFVISKDGNIDDIKIERTGGYEFDQEAIRAVKKMPKWKPGKMGDKPVSVRFRLPIKFTYLN